MLWATARALRAMPALRATAMLGSPQEASQLRCASGENNNKARQPEKSRGVTLAEVAIPNQGEIFHVSECKKLSFGQV